MSNKSFVKNFPLCKRGITYLQLCKPRVVLLMLLTAVIGMILAAPKTALPLVTMAWATLGIALASSAGAVINHLIDHRIDAIMYRTQRRPIPTGKVTPQHAFLFAAFLITTSMTILTLRVNALTAVLTFISMLGYAVIYTMFLKHITPQNIVIGGIAGAAPPMLGWVAISGYIHPYSLLLMLIIFIWTPPHFWSLAIHRYEEYAKANIPMLPVTHGVAFTKLTILLYIILLIAISILPYVIGMSGHIYFVSVLMLNAGFLYWGLLLFFDKHRLASIKTFRYSIWYLLLLFSALLVDHYLN